MKYILRISLALASALFALNTAHAALTSNGNGLVYDTVANVTWSSDADLLETMEASNPNLINSIISAVPSVTDSLGIHPVTSGDYSLAGYSDWYGAEAFVSYLSSINYLGYKGWMLPTTYSQSCASYNCTNSMLGELFYGELGGVIFNLAGTPVFNVLNTANLNLFVHVTSLGFWSGTEYTANLGSSWTFSPVTGIQGSDPKYDIFTSWAVLPGNVANIAAVPEPGEWALMLAGFGLFGFMAGTKSLKLSI